jgi:hypothetical protein
MASAETPHANAAEDVSARLLQCCESRPSDGNPGKNGSYSEEALGAVAEPNSLEIDGQSIDFK